jgi:hypothetical protein
MQFNCEPTQCDRQFYNATVNQHNGIVLPYNTIVNRYNAIAGIADYLKSQLINCINSSLVGIADCAPLTVAANAPAAAAH